MKTGEAEKRRKLIESYVKAFGGRGAAMFFIGATVGELRAAGVDLEDIADALKLAHRKSVPS